MWFGLTWRLGTWFIFVVFEFLIKFYIEQLLIPTRFGVQIVRTRVEVIDETVVV